MVKGQTIGKSNNVEYIAILTDPIKFFDPLQHVLRSSSFVLVNCKREM